jgi:hypothetical protein
MYDFNKPDLLIHPKFFKNIINTYDLERYFNVYSIDDLKPSQFSDTGTSLAYYVSNTRVNPISLMLEPYYGGASQNNSSSSSSSCSGSSVQCTTYWFDDATPMYTLERRNPRYVIWTKNNPMTVCATHVDRVDEYGLYVAVQLAKDWSTPLYEAKTIIVFDLDNTLIDSYGKKLKYADKILEYAKRTYDYVVLWSHGSPLHVDDNVQKFQTNTAQGDEIFDLILRNEHESPTAKNLLYLYNYFPNCHFTRATLIDDSPYNWTPEYTRMIIPDRSATSLKHALKLL